MTNRIPALAMTGEGFAIYSIAGYDTYAFVYRNAEDPANPTRNIMLISRILYQKMTIVFGGDPQSFDQQWPAVQKMIDSIKITGIR
jgi:hypothetical protein